MDAPTDKERLEAMIVDRDGWRRRAQVAEDTLEDVRRALGLPKREPGLVVHELTEDTVTLSLGDLSDAVSQRIGGSISRSVPRSVPR